MKYIKKFENIDWSFEDEEYEIKDLKTYYIKYNTKKECMNIMDKLVELGYEVGDYGNYSDYDQWNGFVYLNSEKCWTQTRREKDEYLEVIYYDDIKNL